MPPEKITTIAIIGANTVVENALSLLLEGAGYSTRILQKPPASAGAASEQPEGVDLLLLMPSLHEEEDEESLLRNIEAAPAAAGVPVLRLSTARKEELNGRAGMVPWPTSFEDLRRAVETALRPALAPAEGKG